VANVLSGVSGGNTLSWTIATSSLVTAGLTSGQTGQNAALVDLKVNSGGLGTDTGGIVTAQDDVLEIKKAADSPSGDVGRGSFATLAIYELDARGAQNTLTVGTTTLTSGTGLPSALGTDANRHTYFRLYDLTNGVVLSDVSTTTEVDVTAGTVVFTDDYTVTPGTTLRMAVQVTDTNTASFPAGTSIQWTVNTAAGLELTTDGAGYGGNVWSIPADANSVRIPT